MKKALITLALFVVAIFVYHYEETLSLAVRTEAILVGNGDNSGIATAALGVHTLADRRMMKLLDDVLITSGRVAAHDQENSDLIKKLQADNVYQKEMAAHLSDPDHGEGWATTEGHKPWIPLQEQQEKEDAEAKEAIQRVKDAIR